ncbi:hypothetical protein D9M72_517270 [compost metagenome]
MASSVTSAVAASAKPFASITAASMSKASLLRSLTSSFSTWSWRLSRTSTQPEAHCTLRITALMEAGSTESESAQAPYKRSLTINGEAIICTIRLPVVPVEMPWRWLSALSAMAVNPSSAALSGQNAIGV